MGERISDERLAEIVAGTGTDCMLYEQRGIALELGALRQQYADGLDAWRRNSEAHAAEIVKLRRENDFLRAHTGNSAKSCVYCGLGAEEQGRCDRGFPGCSRADDQMLCREACVAMERDELRRANAEMARDAARYQWLRGRGASRDSALYDLSLYEYIETDFDHKVDSHMEASLSAQGGEG